MLIRSRYAALTVLFVGIIAVAGGVMLAADTAKSADANRVDGKRQDAQRQERAAAAKESRAAAVKTNAQAVSANSDGYRALAPGVEITIPPKLDEADTFSTHDFVEVLSGVPNLNWSPKLSAKSRTLKEMATAQVFRRKIWCLEFTFKPVRMIQVDVPQEDGKLQRKLIWYLVYHVKNSGGHLQPVRQQDGAYEIKKVDEPVVFEPQFVLEAPEFDNKAYLDRVIPAAMEPIRQKEDPRRRFLNSVEIGQRPIPVSKAGEDRGVWGVATWEDVDPRIDFFSVFIQGLTNAYRWDDMPGGFKAGDPPAKGRVLMPATLRLNFWRPGDEFNESSRQIRFGLPESARVRELNIPQVDFEWIYR